jgi:hypothetical protein
LERDGFTVQHEDDYNWALVKPGLQDVVILPKSGRLVALQVMYRILEVAEITDGRYMELLAQVSP